MTRSCIVLASGGLDSMLATRLLVDQSLHVIVYHALHVFEGKEAREAVAQDIEERFLALGAKEAVCEDFSPILIELAKKPKYGHGKTLNPCIDCHLHMMKQAATLMREKGASFLATGEVLGQRGKSQTRFAWKLIDRELDALGLRKLLLRPLSAKLREPTLPEREGWVEREKLLDLHGRTRTPQMQMAKDCGIADYPTPAGGCLLTDPGYCARLEELARHKPDWDGRDAELLKWGRHIRIAPGVKIVASRNKDDGDHLKRLGAPGDFFFVTKERPGALVLLHGGGDDESRRIAAGLAVYYSKFRQAGEAEVAMWPAELGPTEETVLPTQPALDPQEIAEKFVSGI